MQDSTKIDLATTDIKAAMEFSDIFMMVCPSFAQEIMFNSMLPYLRERHEKFFISSWKTMED